MSQHRKTLNDLNVSIDVGTVLACKMYFEEILLNASSTQPMIFHQISPGMEAAIGFLNEYLKERGIASET